jgi:hypothetical protein
VVAESDDEETVDNMTSLVDRDTNTEEGLRSRSALLLSPKQVSDHDASRIDDVCGSATKQPLSESALLLSAATQAVQSKLTESALLYEQQTQAIQNPLSDSALLCAPTQAVTGKQLSDSELLYEPTQAVTGKQLSDSELLYEPTQAVTSKQLSDSELLYEPTQAVGIKFTDSELMYAPTQNVTDGKLSESELMCAPTQNVTDNKLSESELMCAQTQNLHEPQRPNNIAADNSNADLQDGDETQSLLEAETQSLLEAETQQLGQDEEQAQPDANAAAQAETDAGSSLQQTSNEAGNQNMSALAGDPDATNPSVGNIQTESLDLTVEADTEQMVSASSAEVSADKEPPKTDDEDLKIRAQAQLVRTSTQKSSAAESRAASCSQPVLVGQQHTTAANSDSMFETSGRSTVRSPPTPELFTDSNLSLIPSTQSQDEYNPSRNPVEDTSDTEDHDTDRDSIAEASSLQTSKELESALREEFENDLEALEREERARESSVEEAFCNAPFVDRARNNQSAENPSQETENTKYDQVQLRPDFLSQPNMTSVSKMSNMTNNHSSLSLIESSLQKSGLSRMPSVSQTVGKERLLAQTNYSAVSMLESSLEPRAGARALPAASKLFSATDYASVSMDQTAVAPADIIVKTTEIAPNSNIPVPPLAKTPQKDIAAGNEEISNADSPILSRSRGESQDVTLSLSSAVALQPKSSGSCSSRLPATDSPVLGRVAGSEKSHTRVMLVKKSGFNLVKPQQDQSIEKERTDGEIEASNKSSLAARDKLEKIESCNTDKREEVEIPVVKTQETVSSDSCELASINTKEIECDKTEETDEARSEPAWDDYSRESEETHNEKTASKAESGKDVLSERPSSATRYGMELCLLV